MGGADTGSGGGGGWKRSTGWSTGQGLTLEVEFTEIIHLITMNPNAPCVIQHSISHIYPTWKLHQHDLNGELTRTHSHMPDGFFFLQTHLFHSLELTAEYTPAHHPPL